MNNSSKSLRKARIFCCGRMRSQLGPMLFYNKFVTMNTVGKNVARVRERKRITQEQLAIRLITLGWKVDRFVISKIERGERQVTDIQVTLIADALQVKLKELFGRE